MNRFQKERASSQIQNKMNESVHFKRLSEREQAVEESNRDLTAFVDKFRYQPKARAQSSCGFRRRSLTCRDSSLPLPSNTIVPTTESLSQVSIETGTIRTKDGNDQNKFKPILVSDVEVGGLTLPVEVARSALRNTAKGQETPRSGRRRS